MKQKKHRYEMHKYWGKKPSKDLYKLIEKYTNEGDLVLDPFAGYGVFTCEAYIMNRNVISNDLNPIANFINKQLMEKDIDLIKLKNEWELIEDKFKKYNSDWYSWTINNQKVELVTILRNNKDIPLKVKFLIEGSKKTIQVDLNKYEAKKYIEFEKKRKVSNWYPKNKLILNSRISAKRGMKISDLFTKRTLACHAKLLSLIEKHSNGPEKDLLKVAFTANLANCSKLVPPIKSKGDMAQGAWMTGFYIGKNYLENNVLHYFKNRLKKIINGKHDYLNKFKQTKLFETTLSNDFIVMQCDAKKLKVESNSIDYVFTDPPYGDTVPYFEQSIIWNSWLNFDPDYENEIVISDSKERNKNEIEYERNINQAFSEIRRVLKKDRYFTLSFHTISGNTWKAIINACIKNGFIVVDFKFLSQKSFTPRQINRLKSIKGDILITLKKSKILKRKQLTISQTEKFILNNLDAWLRNNELSINEIIIKSTEELFSNNQPISNFDLLKLLRNNYKLLKNNKWTKND
tara:strand:- start:1285 stop:2835 length:1551 start_codon:yes stop_codon:yes gene_type:complete